MAAGRGRGCAAGADTCLGSGWPKHAETFSYDADGRIQQQLILGRQLGWTAGAPTDGGAFQVTNLGALQNLASVNFAGRLRGYTYQYAQHEEGSGAAADDPKGYTHRYNYTYEARDSYLEARVTGASSNQNFRASSTFSTYDAWGRRVAVRENTPLASNLGTLDDRIRYFSYDATGNILRRREGTLENGLFTQDAAQKTQTQLYAYVGGQLVASGKRTGEVDVVGRLTAYQSNNAAGSSRTTVLAGETLRGIAQRVYGNANLWYVLAEANAISDDSGLTAGTTLVVPEVKVTSNDATTFKPFNPQEAIGNTSPSLPYIEPPPKEHCNGIAMVLMVVVAVVAAVFTAGAALALIAPSLMVGGVMATGAAVLTGGIGVSTAAIGAVAAGAAVAGAAFAGGMAGSIASQAVGKAMGVVDSFSLRSAVASGLTAMAGAGIAGAIGGGQSVGQLIKAGGTGYAKVAAMGAATAGAGYAGGKIAGVADTHFSWRAIAAGAVSSVVGGKINQSLGIGNQPYVSDGIVNDTLGGMVGGVVSLHTRRTFGLNDVINYGAIAADAFGNALGSALASKLDTYIPVPQRVRNASIAGGGSFAERYPYATAELGDQRSALGDGSPDVRSTDHITNLPAVQVGVSDAEWMAQGLTMQQIAELRWAFASHAMAAQDRGRGNEIDVSAFDGGGDVPSHQATYTRSLRPGSGREAGPLTVTPELVFAPLEPFTLTDQVIGLSAALERDAATFSTGVPDRRPEDLVRPRDLSDYDSRGSLMPIYTRFDRSLEDVIASNNQLMDAAAGSPVAAAAQHAARAVGGNDRLVHLASDAGTVTGDVILSGYGGKSPVRISSAVRSRGAAPPSGTPGPHTRLSQVGGLRATEGTRVMRQNGTLTEPTHPLAKHAPEVTDLYIQGRLVNEVIGKAGIGSRTVFNNRGQMESSIAKALDARGADVSAWLATYPVAGKTRAFDFNPGMGNLGKGFEITTVGGCINPITRSMPNVKVVLISDGSGGYLIHTAHPF